MVEMTRFPYAFAIPRHHLAGRLVEGGLYVVILGSVWGIWNLIQSMN